MLTHRERVNLEPMKQAQDYFERGTLNASGAHTTASGASTMNLICGPFIPNSTIRCPDGATATELGAEARKINVQF